MEREAAARAIVDAVRRDRKRLPRSVWVVALVLSAVCVGGLAIAWLEDRDTKPERPLPMQVVAAQSAGGLGLGIVLGVGIGVAIGAAFSLRRPAPRG